MGIIPDSWIQAVSDDWHFSLDRPDAIKLDRHVYQEIIKIFEWSSVAAVFLAAGEKFSSIPANIIGLTIVALTSQYIITFTPVYWSASEHKFAGKSESRRQLVRIIASSMMFGLLTATINYTLKPVIASIIGDEASQKFDCPGTWI